ncbi:8805_t:CDS:2, partial [Cetraspora pellucida]
MDYTNEHVSDDNSYTDLYPDPYSDLYSDLYTDSDIGSQDNKESSSTAAKRKTTEKSVDEQHVKKIWVNIINPVVNKSYVWKYFQTENEHDFCKIFMLKKGIEEECGANYKHDEGTSNMKFYLRTKHGILGPDDLIQDSNKQQLQIDKMIRKVSSHKKTIQRELKRIMAEWISITPNIINATIEANFVVEQIICKVITCLTPCSPYLPSPWVLYPILIFAIFDLSS